MIDSCKTPPEHLPIHHRSGRSGAVIRIEMTRQNTNHPNKRLRHSGQASCEVACRRFKAQGPAPIYRITTFLWLHGHGGADFEVHDDRSPFGRPGGLAMRGRVRNWARLVKGKPTFGKDAPCETDFSSGERDMVAQAAGRVTETDSSRPENARTAATHPSDGPDHPQEHDRAPVALVAGPRREVA